MPGGDREAWDEVGEILTAIAVDVDGTPCCVYVGADGAGHYVKMVHNGIEYADMQLIAESYDLLRHGAGLDVKDDRDVFDDWNRGDLESFLIEITAKVLARDDEATGEPLVDVILDQAEQKGTGRWTSQDALELGVPLTAITEAVFARSLSALRDQRVAAADVLAGPAARARAAQDRGIVDDIRAALYASKVVAYAQGFEQMQAASEKFDWDLDLGAMATIWRGGCIIRARFLNRIRDAYAGGEVVNLLTVPYFTDAMDAGAGPVAPRDRQGGRAGHPGAGVLLLPRLLRRLPPRARARLADPGPARLLRRAHLQARRPRGHVPPALGAGRARGARLSRHRAAPAGLRRASARAWRGASPGSPRWSATRRCWPPASAPWRRT